MKNSEIMSRAMAEATGIPFDDVQQLMAAILASLPPDNPLNDETPDFEAARLLRCFRRERAGIRQWLLRGYMEAVADGLPPHPLTWS